MDRGKKLREYGTGSVSQLKDGRWTARMVIGTTTDGKPKVKAFYGDSEREVKKKLKDFQKDFALNGSKPNLKGTVEKYMTDWLYHNKQNTLNPKSFDRLEQTLRYQVFPYVGGLQVATFCSADVQKFLNTLRDKGLSHSTIKKAYDAINDCFRTGVMQHTVTSNPAAGVTVPPKSSFPKSDIRVYSKDEMDALCDAALATYSNGKRVYRLGAVVVLDLNTGLRSAELLGLKWSDIDFKNRELSVSNTRVLVKTRTEKSKTKYCAITQDSAKTHNSIRTIYLNDAACMALHILFDATGKFEYVVSNSSGCPLYPRYLDALFRKIAVAAGLPEDRIFGLHALRHTFASQLFASGADVKTVSEILGHSDVTTTFNTYVHLINDQQKKAVLKIDNIT